MALIPFDGELDAPAAGLTPFTGKLDGEPEGFADTIKQGLGDIGLKLNVGTTVDIPEQVSGINELARRVSPSGIVAERVIPDFIKTWRSGVEEQARGLIDSRRKGLSAELSPEQQASDKKQYFSDDASWANLTKDGITAAPGKVADLAAEGKLFGEGWSDWRKPVGGAAQSLPSSVLMMAPTAMASRTAAKAATAEALAAGLGEQAAAKAGITAAERTAMVAGGLSEGAQGAGSGYEQTRRTVMEMPIDKLSASPFFQKQLEANGGNVDAARLKAAEEAGMASASGAFWFDALFGALGDRYIGSAAAGKGTRGGAIVRGAAQETPTEFIQSGGEKASENLAIKRFADPNQKLMQDVGEEAVGGALSGGLMGAGMGGAFHRNSPAEDGTAGPPAPAAQLPDTGPMSRSANLAISTGAAADAASVLGVPADAEQAGEQIAPKSMDAIGRVQQIDQQIQSADPEQAATMKAERDQITAEWPQAVSGAPTSFSTESGARIDGNYALMEAHQLVTSHDEKLKPNPAYPREMQPRERDRAASEMQISSIVQRLDPARLGESGDAGTGAPIVGADGLVESGNARTIALKRAYQGNPEKAEAYRQYLSDNAARFGVTPESVAAMNTPVLVRVRNTPVDRAEFARQANASTVAQMSSSEQARADAARIDDMGDMRPDENGDFATSRDFIRRFVSRLPATEQGGMVDSTGQLSQAGYARVRNAVLAKAYGDSPVLGRMVESLDDNMRNIGKALMRSAPEIAKLRQDVSEGALFDADVTPDLLAAVEEMSRIKDSGQSVAEYLSQGSLMGNATSPEAREMLKFLAVNMRRPGKIVEFIRNYTEALRAAGNPNQGSLLGEKTAPTKRGIINAAKGEENGQTETDSTAPGQPSGKQAEGRPAEQGAEIARGEGAGKQAGEEPASTPGDRGGAQEGEVKATGKYRDGAGWSRRYYTVKRTDGSFALVREMTDEDGTKVEHLRPDGSWNKGKPPATAAFGAHAEEYAPETFASEDEALKSARDDVSDSGGNVQGDETRLSRAPSNPKNVYRAYPLAAADREKLLNRFPPKYARVVADHLTAEGLRSMDKVIEGPATGAVIGESVGGGIQSLIVTVNGNETTTDGTPFHITWSAEPGVSTGTAGEAAKKHGFARLKAPIAIDLSGGPSISSPLRETRNEGETDKMFAKRVVDKRDAPKSLPENHADYFLMDGATVVSVADLVSTKSDEENQQGGDNGPKRMAAAARGELGKRAPITVMPSKTEPGKYEVVDGNGTLTSVKKFGWKSLPVNVVERLDGHKITWADKYADATKVVAASGGLMFNGQPYIIKDSNIDKTHDLPKILAAGVDAAVLDRAGAFVKKHYSKKPDAQVSDADMARAEEMLKPKLELADQAKNGYDQMVLDVAEASNSLGVLLAPLKTIGRAAVKLVNDEKFDVDGIKDLLRSTVVVSKLTDAQKVIDEISKRFKIMRIKNRSMTDLHGHNLKDEDRMRFGGYADVLVNVIMPNGTVAEIQINTPLMSAAKSEDGHKLYEIYRDLDQDSDFAKEVKAEMEAYYNAAFHSMNATLDLALFKKLASDIGAAPDIGNPSRGLMVSPESSSTNTLPSGNLTKSSPENDAKNSQPGGNLSGTFISATSKDIVAEGEEKEYTEPVKGQKGAQNVDGNNGSPGAQGQEPGTVQGTVGQRGTESVRDGTGGRDQLGNRNADNGTVEQGQDGGKEPDGGSGATQGVRGDGQGNRAGRPAGVPAGRGAGEWVAFPAETGTLGIPRAEMPQVKNDIRPELFSFLKERGIHHETESVSAASLRPTQAEFSTAKAMNWVEVREGIDRFVLTSSDGFVLDGHHQWIAALAVGENVKAIQFNAPIDKLLAAVYAFPGTKRGEGAPGGQAQARQDFQAALADLGALFRQINPGVRMLMPEEKVKLMPTLVKLFESGIKQVGYSMKDLIAHVKAAMKASADEFVKKHWNKLDEKTYREAAAQAIDNVQNAPQEVGQTANMFAIPKPGPAPVQGDMFAAMEKVAPEVFKKAAEPKAKPENPTETTKGVKNEQGKKAEVLTTPPAPKPSAPAGRDIPQKTGRNYAFGDDDLTYAGSWIQKATQNVEAVELLVKLDQEKRQATREEQAVLAKFIGWGASDLANSLFGDKLNKPLQEINEYEVAIAAFDKIGRDYLRKGGNYRGDYGDSGYYSAVGVLRNAGKILGYGPTPERITKAEVIAAKPDMTAKKWNELRDRLKAVMTKDELADAARSTQYAHYTSKPIVKSMMSALQRMGFKGGTILEPGAGIGVFPGLMPVDMANNSAYTGIEFDAITGRILKQLFPDERILVESFIDTALPQNYYDVAFGNPPFGNIPILADPKYRKYAFSLHDYFFAKTIDSVKPGGLVPFVTSRYTMDKLNDKARAYLAERADLVGAIRLPQTAFKKNAGTDVVTDVLFLRKKVPGETFEGGQSWAKSVPITINGRQFNINEYFHDHPEMVLGKNSDAGKMANSPDPQYTVEAIEGDIDTLFDKAAGTLPENIYRAVHDTAAEDAKVRDIDFNPKAKKEGNYYVTDAGVLMVREGGIGKRAEIKSAGQEAIVKDFVPLRDALKQAHFDQLNNGEWEKSLAELQKAYRAFVKKNGQIHKHTTYMQNVKVDELDDEGNPTGRKVADQEQRYRMPTLNAIRDDPDWTLVASLESFNEETGEINEGAFLTDRVLKRRAPAKVETPTDAMLQVLNDIGKIDIAETARRIGLSEQETINSLGALVYNDPSAGWVTADDYLSGDIRKKLKEARAAADTDRLYQRNVEALISALPNSKTAAEITPQIGMSWIPTSIYEDFLREKANVRATVTFNERLGQWDVEAISGHQGLEATQDWGTPRRNAADILGYALSGAPVRIMQSVGFGSNRKEVFDPVATQAVTEKLNNMREAFKTWLWEDPARVETLVPIYNEKFNSIVPRSFNGDHLTLPGVSERWMKLGVFPHVKRGAWRIIQQGNTYLAHAVGSGKTNQMIISAMEQKRLGLIQKPMMVVPNHMLKQFASEWMDLYPAARLMVADEANFTGDNRRRFVARAALSDLDGVIITHSAFKLLDLDPVFKQKMIEEQLQYLRAALKEAGGTEEKTANGKSKNRDPKVKQIEKKIERWEQKLAATMSSEGKDKNVRFDEMGVDMLYVDEAHNFRKLEFTTQRQVKGIDSGGSDMAADLHMKVQWLRENKNPKRNLVMASGTPVTNTLAEIYSVQRLMAPDVLAARGLEEFDQWASMFGAESTNIEPDASGRYGPVTRFNKFVNVGELTQMFREFADVLTSDYLAATLGDKRPKVKGGSRNMIITPKTQAYTDFQRDVLQPRMKTSREWKPSRDEPNNPDPIIAIIGDGRLAAIDLRFMDPKAPNDPDSKLNRMIDEVIRVYKETADREFTTDGKPGSKVEPAKGAVQMVFADLGFGAGVAANRGFSARAWFEKRLREAGVKPEHVAFMSDNKKSSAKVKLFRDMNAGRVRIAVGSSKNMGTGVNAQQRLVALHHLDSPWYPADLEQREGRIVRQGNKHKEVELYAYAMKGSYDEQMWSTLARKQFFIDQALSGDANIREIEDLGESSQFEIAAAMVADDPRVLQLAGLRAEVEKLGRLRSAHDDQRGRMQREYAAAEARLGWIEQKLADLRTDAAKVQDITGDKFTAKADGKTFNTRKEWGQALMARYKDLSDHLVDKETVIGSISGFDVIYQGRMSKATTTSITTYTDGTTKTETSKRFESAIGIRASEPTILAQDVTSDPVGVAMRAQTTLAGIARAPAALESEANDLKAKRNALEPRLTAQFPMLQMLLDKMGEAAVLEDAIVASGQALTGLEREQELEDAWQARTGAITPLFSRGNGAGMAVRDLKSTVDRVASGFKNLPKVHVFASPAELSTKDPAQKALADFILKAGAWEDVEGAMHQGEIYLFASGLADAARAEHVLATHEVTHYGLRGAIGKGLDSALHHIWLNNAAVRKEAAAIKRRNGLASNTEAVEEVLADMPAADLVKLKGWRRVVMVARDWLRNAGATNLAGRIDSWLNSTLDDQQKADLFVADLVNAARNFARNGKPASVMAGTRLADGTLAEDVAKQEKWLTAEAKARGYASIDEMAEKNYPAFEKLATKWREQNPVENALLSRSGVESSYGLPNEQPGNRAFDRAEIRALRRLAAGMERPEAGITFRITDDGIAIATGPKGTRVPERYIRFANNNGLSFESRRLPIGGGTEAPAMPAIYRADGALYFGEMASNARPIDRTGKTRFSRSAPTPTAAERADAILAKPAGTWRPVDAVMRAVTQAVRIDKATGYLYDKAATLIDRYTPEQIKAGVVADYGIPEAVIDRRVEMQGRQRAQIRQAGALLEKLSTLTRAESRLAYEWMNNNDPQAAAYFEKQLSPESIAVMEEIKTMVDDLSKEAVALGQLSPEAYKRNRFEYLHRSYAKYTAEQTKGETKGRQRAIAVLGDQYKGRGMSDAVDMAKVQNVAPEWWGRKLQAGQADKGLIGAKFVRYERRAPTGEGSGALETAQGPGNTNPQKKGKLLEVAYWPADEKAPAKYSTWDQSGTWEVRDTKGGKLIVWRDFTKAERTAMGEIDEARYAIAKTLHGMVHDVETGRYLEWIGSTYGKVKGEQINGEIVEASDRMRDTFAPGTWVQVPETKIPGTSVSKYGALAGKFVPGPIWNDVRQSVGFRFGPELWRDILGAWKTAKTALSPAVHTNNVMANFVMADWHDVSAGHIAKALRIILGASKREGKGILGRTGNLAARAGSADAEAAREIIARFHESGANMGSWVNAELQREQIEPLLDALEAEIGLAGQHTADAQVGAFAALQKALQLRFPSAWDAFKPTAAGKALTTEAGNMLDLYEGEDQVFRLAAWLKAKEDGESDLVAGRRARRSFLDYHINAPWIQAMRNSAFPFISFTYRAVPMLLETAARKPHKLMKLAMFAGLVNALGYLLSGGDEDDERRLLPEEKAGRVWGLVPKLVRMPWNDKFGSPVFLDIRRFVPVGDIFDTGQNHAAIPMLPFAVPGGPLAIISEIVSNKSQFTGRPITLETDTGAEKAAKLADHLYKAFAPNIVILPGTHAFTGVVNAGSGRTDSFGREQSVVQAGLTSFGVKVGSYPKDVLMLNAMRQAEGQMMEIDRQITQEKRELQRRGVSEDEFMKNVDSLIVKKQGIAERLQKRLGGG